jgi:hypothetical protein
MASLIIRSGATGATGVKNAPLTNAEIDTNFSNLNTDIQTRVLSSDYEDSDVLTKIKNVDGAGSGLDADLLDGLNTSSSDTSGDTVVIRSSGSFSANAVTLTQLNTRNIYLGASGAIVFEGATDDTYETTLTVTDPTADRTITIPNVTGTVVTTGDTGSVTNTMLAGSIANAKLANSSITIDGNSVSLGGTLTIGAGLISADNTWTGTQTFRDNKFLVTDDSDNTKILALQLSNIATGTTRTLTIPNESGTIATQGYVQTPVVYGATGSTGPATGQNSQGTKYISTSAPGATGVAGDVWYRI